MTYIAATATAHDRQNSKDGRQQFATMIRAILTLWGIAPECAYCSAPIAHDGCQYDDSASRDRIVTESEGGLYHLDNLILACHACNSLRGDMTFSRWCQFLADGDIDAARDREQNLRQWAAWSGASSRRFRRLLKEAGRG